MSTNASNAMTDLLAAADAAYWAGNPIMTDREFDARCAVEQVPAHIGAFAAAPGACKLQFPMLSLAKGELLNLPDWLFRLDGRILIEPKVDGLAVELQYIGGVLTAAITRGNGKGGMDIAPLLSRTPWARLAARVDITAHVELYIPADALSCLAARGRKYASPRSAVAAIVNATSGGDFADCLAIAVHEVMPIDGERDIFAGYDRAHAAGLPVLPHLSMLARDVDVETLRRALRAFRADFPVDGVVLKLTDLQRRAELGATRTAPRYAVAFKDYTLA